MTVGAAEHYIIKIITFKTDSVVFLFLIYQSILLAQNCVLHDCLRV